MLAERWNRLRYRLYAPVYDFFATPVEKGRRRAYEVADPKPDEKILLVGCGTGIGLEHLPDGSEAVAVDAVPNMVRRTRNRAANLEVDTEAVVADGHRLPLKEDTFDVVVLHLVLSVLTRPEELLAEADRVVSEDGRVSIYDKFVDPDSPPPFPRRLLNPLARLVFSDLNRSLEPMLEETSLRIESREDVLHDLFTVTVARPS
jgi:ubiquinone/menaquinone biosynthesis C-methylase UbiE